MGFIVVNGYTPGPVTVYFHDGTSITPLGSLPLAAVETGTFFNNNTRSLVVLNRIFIFQGDTTGDAKIFKSTDEGSTFTLDTTLSTFPANTSCWAAPVPVMVLGALKYIGLYQDSATGTIRYLIYDVATDSWSEVSSGATSGVTTICGPVSHNGKLYFRTNNNNYWVYDPVSGSTTSLTGTTGTSVDALIVWNNTVVIMQRNLGSGNAELRYLSGTTFTLGTNFGVIGAAASGRFAMAVDPNTNNLIVVAPNTINTRVFIVDPTWAYTDLTATVATTGLSTLADPPVYPLVSQGGSVVEFLAMASRSGAASVQRFTWVDQATPMVAAGVIAGAGSYFWPNVYDGADHWLFNPGQRRVAQVSQVVYANGIKPTIQCYRSSGGTSSATLEYRSLANLGDVTEIPSHAATIENPTGDPGLALTGVNPGAQIDNIPNDNTPITFEWNQSTDGLFTGEDYDYRLRVF
ncbi:MAG: hypothetical protein AB7L09_00030 [Nitrospira sp.]